MVAPIIVAGARVAATSTARTGARTTGSSTGRASVQGVRGSTPRQSPSRSMGNTRSGVEEIGGEVVSDRSRPRQDGIVRAKRIRENVKNNIEEDSFEGSVSQAQPVKYRIGMLISLILLLVATFLDITELILDLAGTFLGGVGVVIGYIKDFFTIVILPFAFLLLKAPFWKGKKAKKKMAVMIGGFVTSLIPWVGAFLPETLASVWITIRLTRKEDEEKSQEKVQNESITRMKRSR